MTSELLARIRSERENSSAAKTTGAPRKSHPAPAGKG
jgi:hypothetical protein